MNESGHTLHPTAALGPIIELRNVSKTFVTGGGIAVDALRGVSLKIFPGEFIAILGASGSGKTTLMNILGCLDRPTTGDYLFDARNVADFGRDELAWLRREAFGFVFQSYNLIATATAAENVEVPAVYAGAGRAERREKADRLLSSLGLQDRQDHRPNQLSGGQQQRVSIARALMNGGQILLADEPTGALDSKSGAEVLALLKSLATEGHTVIIITHDREVAAQTHRQIELKDGEIVADTGPDPASLVAPAQQFVLAPANSGSSALADMGEAMRMALTSLRVNVFRTILTLLGVMIGVASVVALLSIGEGAKQSVLDRISAMGNNLLLVRGGARNQRGFGGNRTLYVEDADAIAGLPGIEAALPEIEGNVTARIGSTDYSTSVTATSSQVPEARNWPVARGTFFTEDDRRTYAAVAVLGKTVLDNLYADKENPIGSYVLLNNVPFLVIGTMTAKGASMGGRDTDDVIFVPVTTGSLRLFGQTNLRAITVSAADASKMDETEARIRDLLIARHGTEDFRINNMAEVMETATETQNTMTVLLGSIAAISLIVGGIGVMNIMLVSVTERTREIGIRMATGARTRNILQQFLMEATIVSGLGGLIGIASGIGVALAMAAFGTEVKVTMLPMLLAFSCAVATGLVFGFAPAMKAAHLDPVVALSSE